MAKFCLTKEQKVKFKDALKNRELDFGKLADLPDSMSRRKFLEKYVGKENAQQVNALYEGKLLLPNQKAAAYRFVEKTLGLSKEAKRDYLAQIQKMDSVFNPKDMKSFFQDLVDEKFKIKPSLEEAKTISDLSKKIVDSESKWQETLKKNPSWQENPIKTRKEWISNPERLDYGMSKVAIENYINDLKLEAKNISFKEQPRRKVVNAIKEAPGVLKSLMSTLDNSFFGRQGIKVLYTSPTTWTRAFIKSWGDIGRQLKGTDAIDLVRADIYSRPNAINGKYKAGRYGLDVLTEEAYPSAFPEKIPVIGRLFKASEAAYNGAALRMRADLADKYIGIAEKQGINTLDPTQAQGIGMLVSSLTGRGSLGKAEVISKEINTALFSVKFLKSNIDQLTAHTILNEKATRFTKVESAKNLAKIVGATAILLTTAKQLNPDSVDQDPTSKNFGKIKVFGKWVDVTGGMGAIVRLSAQVGQFIDKKVIQKEPSKFGERTGLDMTEQFFEGKASPFFGVLLDYMRGSNRVGMPVKPLDQLKNVTLPLSAQNLMDLMKDPQADNIAGLMLLDGLGFSVSISPEPNQKSKAIPLNKKISERNLIDTVSVYSQALGSDPETAFNRIFTGQTIRRVDNGTIIVERMSVGQSQAEKKKQNKNNPQMKLDHTVPLEIGGSNDTKNLKIVTTSEWRSYTKVENALGRALKAKKISKGEAQKEIVKFKSFTDVKDRKQYGEYLLGKYK